MNYKTVIRLFFLILIAVCVFQLEGNTAKWMTIFFVLMSWAVNLMPDPPKKKQPWEIEGGKYHGRF